MRPSRRLWGSLVLVVVALLAGYVSLGDRSGREPSIAPRPGAGSDAAVKVFCAACHALPPPDVLTRALWTETIDRMFEIARGDAGKVPAGFPPREHAVEYYLSRAPQSFPPIESTAGAGSGPVAFRSKPLRFPNRAPYPGVANVQAVDVVGDGSLELLLCDMRFSEVRLVEDPASPSPRTTVLGRVPHPCRATVTDLDSDGRRDVVIADLGTVTPSDETNGSVVWLRGTESGAFLPVTLLAGLGRVADVQPGDFDGDGDPDLIVAVFGWRRVGNILYVENGVRDDGGRRFTPFEIDARPGAIDVPVVDLDGDGRLDFVALISQQHETIVAFLNRAPGVFEPRTIYTAAHPHWGSTGIEVLDFDADGDLDVLFSNGDSLDDLVVKHYQGVQWLENRGEFPFVFHRLADLYGATCARAGDIDGDGDLDVLISAFLPFVRASTPDAARIESLIWLERVAGGKFRRHSLRASTPYYPSIALADLDADGDLDLAVSCMTMAKRSTDRIEQSALVFENVGPAGTAPR